ncbi:hypothetical protein IV203_038758 [Nitzschia inconspicua]|uniref:Uncharacterized protein n=1 Tax=Nitzschia inconspicua TaxID=303405 RepID=A0A9K3LN44_9STRA|nr:hypothetical protein IV203_038758 [Nitzschia inconspicua]
MPPQKEQRETAGKSTDIAPRKRSPNFTNLEDVLLCQAYVNAIQSPPVQGNDSIVVAPPLWNKVSEGFQSLVEDQKDKLESWVQGVERPKKSLEDRFKKQICYQVSRWNPLYKKAYDGRVSGTDEEDIRHEAGLAFLKQYEAAFKFGHCIDTLRKSPTFNPTHELWVAGGEMDTAKGNKKPSATSNTNTSTAKKSTPPRPMLVTKAVRAEQQRKDLSTSFENYKKYMERMIANKEKMAQLREMDELRKIYKIFKNIGEPKTAQKILTQYMHVSKKYVSIVETPSSPNRQSDTTMGSNDDEQDENFANVMERMVASNERLAHFREVGALRKNYKLFKNMGETEEAQKMLDRLTQLLLLRVEGVPSDVEIRHSSPFNCQSDISIGPNDE